MRTLHDEEGALAFIGGHGGDASYQMIAVTNGEGYQDFVQCANSASDPGSNIPGMQGADVSDAFFRVVVTYSIHIDLGAKIFRENEWFQIGLFRLDDVFGQEISLGIRLKIGEEDGFSLAFEYFTENDFRGPLFLTTGSRTTDLFEIATGLGTWMGGENLMMGIEPDNYAGINSDAFVQAFRDRYGVEPSNHGSNAYDCAYALALLYAGEDATPADIKQGMQYFKEPNRTDDEVPIGIGPDEFARAAQTVRDGQRIDFQGASGRLLFDENGDRPRQGLCTFGPNAEATAFETKDCYDENMEKI